MPVINLPLPHKKVFNDVFYPYLKPTNYRYEIYYGGAGSGKSVFISQSYIYRMLLAPMLNLLVIRQTADSNRDSTFALFKQVINQWKLNGDSTHKDCFIIRESDMRITCKLNGNSIIFKGLDDPEKIKSVTFAKGELTDIWVEEASEIEESAFKQLDVRLRGGKSHKQVRISFNPIYREHWLKAFIDNKQPDKLSLHTTYKDNKFLDEPYRRLLESYKDTDPYYYMVYCLGQWGTLGKTIFDAQKVSDRIETIRGIRPSKVGYFAYDYVNQMIVDDSIRFIESDDGYIKIFEPVKKGYPYVIGGDTSGEGSDYFIGQVINNTNGKQVCTLRHQFDEDLYTKQMYCLGKYYNDALIGLESNFSTYPLQELQRLKYSKQYMREQEDSITHKVEKKFGFRTTSLTRPLIIAALVTIVREQTELFNDVDTLSEMLTFVRDEKGKPCASKGAHDDTIMGMAITYYIRSQQTYYVEVNEDGKTLHYTEDMLEDFFNADDEGRAYLIKKWGKPQ